MTALAVIGVGLIGGSLLLSLRERGWPGRLLGIDPQWQRASKILGAGVELTDSTDHEATRVALASAELIVLSMPVRVIREQLPYVLGFEATVTDCGSTKRGIVADAARCPGAARFVPGHPMAGLPEAGVEHATSDLFVGRRWILCPERSAPASLASVENLVRKVGAEPVSMSPAQHDRAVALTSHVPQVLASALFAAASELGADTAAGPGFASATRVAGGSADIWADIFASNADEVSWALRRIIDELQPIAAELEGGSPANTQAVMHLLARARAARRES